MTSTYRTTIDARIEKEKAAMIDALRKMPIIEVACQKTGVGTTTYYRWRQNDKDFLEKSNAAFTEGKRFLIDLARTQMVSLMKEKHWPAIKYIIEHSDESLGGSFGGESRMGFEGLSPEQEQIVKAALQKVEPRKARKIWAKKQKPKIKILPKSIPQPPRQLSLIERLEGMSRGEA